MKGCIFITADDAAYGISLTGFRQMLSNRERILEDIEQIVAEQSTGLVFIDERLLTGKISGRIEVIEKRWPGAIVILPGPSETEKEPAKEDYGMQLVSRVLGYQMKLS